MLHPNVARLGTESSFEVLARAQELKRQGRPIINLGIGQPDFPSPPHVVEAAIQALRDGQHGYTPTPGIPELRAAVCSDIHKRHQAQVSPEQIIIVPGGKVTMFLAVMLCVQAGQEVLYPDPGFPIYGSLAAYSGARPVPYPLYEKDAFALRAGEILERLTPTTSLLVLNTPSNPTGGISDAAELDALVKGLADFPNVVILSDEIYDRILYDDAQHISLLRYPEIRDRLILLNGWSKTYAMTGWRLGYGVWPESLVTAAIRLSINLHSCVNSAAQYAGLAALCGPQDAAENMRVTFARRRQAIVAQLNSLPGVRCAKPQGAFYAFPSIAGCGYDDLQLQKILLEELSVATIAGSGFGQQGRGFLRFSYAASEEDIATALKRFGQWLDQSPSGPHPSGSHPSGPHPSGPHPSGSYPSPS